MGIQKFTDLNTWKEAHKLVLIIYGVIDNYPKKETYILVSQMLRAAISITSNIAEGFGRRGKKEKIQFYYLAQASLTELQNQLIISKDIGYLPENKFYYVWEQTVIVHKLITGLIKSIKSR
ncbi:MAG: S23 ribosomal protein [Microgenomates group bacterium GW2011_GWC1_37_8]|nr:MAG: S23 ribosomal protein [Microgenomates group bacterium GW2011_GWC1_37_8]